ncbi:MBL fold metallo-hydrolase [Edaphobacter sp. HDX4]|uniref:Rieske 2Fe-2S domain-containing protein n=1 Tax=Edaphobacter sp. HDX4 TaxID=2794064 RepID=UPI002FE56A59
MQITYLGHAGFIVETADAAVIMDPWLSETGAFDSSWFQLPRNHHLGPLVYEKLRDQRRALYVYVSHEHQDHFDITFLKSLPVRRFTLLVPEFGRSALMEHFEGYECKEIVFFKHRQEVSIPGGSLKFYVDDSRANRDSAVLVKADNTTFLNMNDCKLFDMLHQVVREEGSIKVFACQFSGATWHPTCYEYPIASYEAMSSKKSLAKFESVAKAIELLSPDVYIPSAGPVCFLDPLIFHLNTEPINIFPRAPKFINYLKVRLRHPPMLMPEMMPGDVLDASSCEITAQGSERITEETALKYISEYAASYAEYFRERGAQQEKVNEEQTMAALHRELERKLSALTLAERVKVPLYFQVGSSGRWLLRVDFARRTVEPAVLNNEINYYEISAPAWQIAKVLAGELTWEEFSLTFRTRLKRNPDVYDPVLHAFLIMEAHDLGRYCDLLLQIESQEERILVEAQGQTFSVRRYCPHQGGDLACGWVDQGRFLTCPRHRWQFDLFRGGLCTTNASDVGAVCLSSDERAERADVVDSSILQTIVDTQRPVTGKSVS